MAVGKIFKIYRQTDRKELNNGITPTYNKTQN